MDNHTEMTLEKARELMEPFKAYKVFPFTWFAKELDGSISTHTVVAAKYFLDGYDMAKSRAELADRYEKVLKDIIDGDPHGGTYSGSQCVDIAKAALQGTGKK